MAEWSKAHDWKSCYPQPGTRVQIPVSPPNKSTLPQSGRVLLFGGSPHDLNPRRSAQSANRHSLRRLPERFSRPLAQTWVRKSLPAQSYYLTRKHSGAPSRREHPPRPTITLTVEDACPYVIPLFPSQISPLPIAFPHNLMYNKDTPSRLVLGTPHSV